MDPSIGRIVHLILTEEHVQQASRRRTTANAISELIKSEKWPLGAQANIGDPLVAGQHVPLIIITVWPNEFANGRPGVNGQAMLDGNDCLWITSAREGTEPGTWHWPERE